MTKLTTHALDTYSGKPAKGMKVDVYFITDKKEKIKSVVLNKDGRSEEDLVDTVKVGNYELIFGNSIAPGIFSNVEVCSALYVPLPSSCGIPVLINVVGLPQPVPLNTEEPSSDSDPVTFRSIVGSPAGLVSFPNILFI